MLIAGWKSAGFTVQKIQAGYTPPFAAGWWFFARTVGTKKDSQFFLTCFHEFCFIGLNWFHWWMNLSKKFGSFTSRSGRLLLQQAVEAAEVRCELWWLMDRWLPCDPNEISVKLENLRIVVILSARLLDLILQLWLKVDTNDACGLELWNQRVLPWGNKSNKSLKKFQLGSVKKATKSR